jgi:hypothetical protein
VVSYLICKPWEPELPAMERCFVGIAPAEAIVNTNTRVATPVRQSCFNRQAVVVVQ